MPLHNLSPIALALLAALVAFVSTLCLTPLAREFAHWVGAVDRPDGQRKLQRKPVALLGGVAVLGGLSITVLGAAALGTMPGSTHTILLVTASLGLLCAVGVLDDICNIKPYWKLAAQFAAIVPLLWTGYEIQTLGLFGFTIELGWLGIVATVLWIIACTNAFNLIDGMDGLCSTVALCLVMGVVGVGLSAGTMHTVICAAAFAGALLGFLAYNRPPASIYLGDAGSMVIGMTVALLTLRVAKAPPGTTYPLVLVALAALPLGDVLLAIVRRSLSGLPIAKADRGHIHHRLLESGFTVTQCLLIVALTCLAAGGIAAASFHFASQAIALSGLILLASILIRSKLMGHHEWALLTAKLAGKLAKTTVPVASATVVLQFRKPPESADNELEKTQRRAA
jgi:UDP-GlcNAc:undecaprenyl-phosphate GlcNAc-1-phosphate transferase